MVQFAFDGQKFSFFHSIYIFGSKKVICEGFQLRSSILRKSLSVSIDSVLQEAQACPELIFTIKAVLKDYQLNGAGQRKRFFVVTEQQQFFVSAYALNNKFPVD